MALYGFVRLWVCIEYKQSVEPFLFSCGREHCFTLPSALCSHCFSRERQRRIRSVPHRRLRCTARHCLPHLVGSAGMEVKQFCAQVL